MSDTSQSGSDFWGVLDSTIDGLSSTGSSVIDGAGNIVGKYNALFGGNDQAPQPVNVVDTRAELNTTPAGGPIQPAKGGFMNWVSDNQAAILIGSVALLAVGLLIVKAR